jgi:ribosomal protein S5
MGIVLGLDKKRARRGLIAHRIPNLYVTYVRNVRSVALALSGKSGATRLVLRVAQKTAGLWLNDEVQ